MRLMTPKLPHLVSERVVVRFLKPFEAPLMTCFREDNRSHLERWEPRRNPNFFTDGFWQINLRVALKDFREGASACMVLLSPAEDEVMGVCNYTNIVRGTFQSCQLGYALAGKHEGQGIMYEALSMTNGYIFDELGLNRIQAAYLPHNERSGQLLAKLGFEKEGFARRYLKINDSWEDHVLTSLINE